MCSVLHNVLPLLQPALSPFSDSLSLRLGSLTLNLASHRNSPARSTKSTTSLSLCLLVSLRFQVLFHSPPGVLFTFPSRYSSLSVTWSYLAFWDGPHFFRQDFSCPDVLRIPLASSGFRLRAFHPLRNTFPDISATLPSLSRGPYPIIISNHGLGFSDFARHYFRNHSCFLLLRVLRCFSSPGSPPMTYLFSHGSHPVTDAEFPHSDIRGS